MATALFFYTYREGFTVLLFLWTYERQCRFQFLELKAKQRLIEQERLTGTLLCHEMKNPLNIIRFFLQETQQRHVSALRRVVVRANPQATTRDQAELFEQLNSAMQGADMLVDTIDNCRALAKLENGAYNLRNGAFDLHELAQSCLSMHEGERKASMLALVLECPKEMVITSDRRLWQHVLMNLIGNAVKFTVDDESVLKPRVEVRIAREPGDVVAVRVSDNGPGVLPSDRALIFGKFVQGSMRPHTHTVGSGLGLHLSLKIAKALKGGLTVESATSSGRGACFLLRVPFR